MRTTLTRIPAKAWLFAFATSLFAALIAQAGKPTPPQPTPAYQFITLPGVGGIEGINNHGVLAVSGPVNASGHTAAVVVPEDTNGDGFPDNYFRDSNGDGINDLMVNIGYPARADIYTFVNWINDAGQVAGRCSFLVSTPAGTNVWQRCFFVVSPRDMDGDGAPDTWYLPGADGGNALMTLFGCTEDRNPAVLGFNNIGQMLVRSYDQSYIIEGKDTDGDGVTDVWYEDFDQDGANDLMTSLGSALYSTGVIVPVSPTGINDDGIVIGYSPFAFVLTPVVDPATGRKVWFQAGPGGINSLVVQLPVITYGDTADINASGSVVGHYDTSLGYGHGSLWTQNALEVWSLTDLGVLGRMNCSWANGLNDRNEVVGMSWRYQGDRIQAMSAFIWRNGVMTDLRPLLDPTGALKTISLEAGDINNQGIIIGSGSGLPHWIAIPTGK